MRNIQDTIYEHERFISEKQDLIYLLSHDLKILLDNRKLYYTYFRRKSQARSKEFAELIHQSSNQQLQYIENFLKVLKEQDELLQDSDELKWIEFDTLIATVEKIVQQSLIIKRSR
jgi:light-regulated signal transduction histidine kinase (bacteriophytochrome)